MQIDGCSDNCIRKLHGLTEFDVLCVLYPRTEQVDLRVLNNPLSDR